MPGMADVTLFQTTQQRLEQARARVDALDVSDEVKAAARKQVNRLDRASRTDLSIASRAVESFHADLDAGEVPILE